MKLVGMLDSPYVRRVAISLQLLGLPFEHASISVFRGFADFQRINPVVKAPTLVCDDGAVMMDSTLMLQYAEALAGRSLWPADVRELQHDLCLTGLALAACEKCAQIVYERGLRPAAKVHEPWIERVRGQLLAACEALERAIGPRALPLAQDALGQADLTIAVAWTFTQHVLPHDVPAARFAGLVAFATAAEALPAFRAAPCSEAPMAARA
jgi:glutathione S-transferase